MKQLIADESEVPATRPLSIDVPRSRAMQLTPSTAVERNENEAEYPRRPGSARLPILLQCPVIVCKKTFKFERDFQYHRVVRIIFLLRD